MSEQKPIPDKTPEMIEADMDARALRIARDTLTGDVRDIILNDMKEVKNSLPWNLRGESAQAVLIDQVTRMSASIVERVVEIVAAGGRQTIRARLNKITIKDTVKAEIELEKSDEQRHELFDAQGMMVQIVIADPEEFRGERAPVDIVPPPKDPDLFIDGEKKSDPI